MSDLENQISIEQAQENATKGAPKEEKPAEEKFDKLTNREALQKAIAEKRGKPEESERKAEPKQEAKPAPAEEVEAPAGFTPDEIKAWKDRDALGIQKAFRRVHDEKLREMTRAQNAEKAAVEEARKEREAAKTWRELGGKMKPYIEARGREGVGAEQAMMEALDLIHAFRNTDPATAKAELKKLGIDLDKSPSQTTAQLPKEVQDRLDSLQKTTEQLQSHIEEQKTLKVVQAFDTVFQHLGSLKTRTGEPVYPGFHDNSDSGKEFAKELGSLTVDPRFQAGVRRRIPEADLTTVVREAYKYLGGKVAGDPVGVSQENPKQIEKSRRAAASAPGRAVSRSESSSLVGKLSNRAAIRQALQDHREH